MSNNNSLTTPWSNTKATLTEWGQSFYANLSDNFLHSSLLLFVVNYLDFFAEEDVYHHTCPPKKLSQDMAKLTSFGLFSFRFMLVPILLKLYVGYKRYDLEKFNRYKQAFLRTERELYLSASELIFLLNSIAKYGIYNLGTLLLSVGIASWPALCSVYKLFRPTFIRGTYQDYFQRLPSKWDYFASSMETTHKFFTLPANVDSFIEMMIDVFYMPNHNNRPRFEKPLTISTMLISGILNMFTPRSDATWNFSQTLQFFMKITFNTWMPLLSLIDCDDPNIMGDHFSTNGIFYALFTLLFTTALSIKIALHAMPNLYKNTPMQPPQLWPSVKNCIGWLWSSNNNHQETTEQQQLITTSRQGGDDVHIIDDYQTF